MPHLGRPDTGALATEIIASVKNIDHLEKLPMKALKILLNGEGRKQVAPRLFEDKAFKNALIESLNGGNDDAIDVASSLV